MSDIAICVENLGKRYRIGGPQQRYKTLRESLVGAVTGPFHRLCNPQSAIRNHETIWALKDVSFEVKQGEAVGIIGRNGAGKSTLLKILSRITEPTEGRVSIHGRVGSLLEVGTGFHPELTGRENIYLNGAILGMRRTEIDRKFDEIVAFAEIERFLDTAVKRYSSGMYVRLAFAVAAHLEPEILLVDEVLAVGDIAFQKRCLGKMEDVARQGRTVLFVSHNLVAIQALCLRTILFDSGCIAADGTSDRVVGRYLLDISSGSVRQPVQMMPRKAGGKAVRLIGVELLTRSGETADSLEFDSELKVRFTLRILDPSRRFFAVECFIVAETGERVFYSSSSPQQSVLIVPTDEIVCVECDIPSLFLASGAYRIDCLVSIPHQERLDEVEGVARFDVTRCDPWNTGFNLTSSIALATSQSRWTIIRGGRELLATAHADQLQARQ